MRLDSSWRLAEICKRFRNRRRHFQQRIGGIQPFEDREIFIILNTVAQHLAANGPDRSCPAAPAILAEKDYLSKKSVWIKLPRLDSKPEHRHRGSADAPGQDKPILTSTDLQSR